MFAPLPAKKNIQKNKANPMKIPGCNFFSPTLIMIGFIMVVLISFYVIRFPKSHIPLIDIKS